MNDLCGKNTWKPLWLYVKDIETSRAGQETWGLNTFTPWVVLTSLFLVVSLPAAGISLW